MTTETQIDPQKAEAFAGQMVGLLNNSMLAVLTSVGHRTELPPRTEHDEVLLGHLRQPDLLTARDRVIRGNREVEALRDQVAPLDVGVARSTGGELEVGATPGDEG